MDPLVCLCVIGVILFLLLILDASTRKTGLPGPRGIPFLGVGLELAVKPLTDVIPWIENLIKNYGSAFEINISGMKIVLITDPVEAEILLSSTSYIQKGYEYFILKPWLREGLLLSEGSKWHSRRKLLTPTFHFKILEDSKSRQAANADRFVKSLLNMNGEPFEVDDLIRNTTLDVICETALGIDMSEVNQEKNDYVTAIKSLTYDATVRFLSFWLHSDLLFGLSSVGKSFYKNLETIRSFSEKVILSRKREYAEMRRKVEPDFTKKRFAFLDRLLEIDAQSPGQLSLDDIQEEVDTFTFEGHDTTSAALKFALFLLANHEDVQERAAEEQFKIFGSDTRHAEMEDLHEMKYLEMVIKESLRLYPSVPVFTRRLTKELPLARGKVIPAGYNVMIWSYFVHRNKEYWSDPEEFRPERFDRDEIRHPFSYLPFSAGARNCIGQKFAMMEMKILLSSVLRNCRLEPVTKTVTLTMNIILTSENPVILKAFPRTF